MEKDFKAIELAMATLDKEFGKNTIFFGNDGDFSDVEVIPTGNFELDLALGVGGLPKGKITEIYGGEGLGKTLIALNCIAHCQAAGGIAAFLDVECDFNAEWAEKLGVDVSKLLISQPASGEQTLQIAETLMKTGQVDLLVIDSIAMMTPQAEIDAGMDEVQVGLQARMLAKGLRKLRKTIETHNVCFIGINQIRDKIGFMQSGTESPGGRTMKFASAIRIELKRMGDIKDKKTNEIIGTTIKAYIKKNKVAPPFKAVEYNNIVGVGFDNFGSILKYALRYGFVIRSGAWYYKDETKKESLGQGEAAAIQYLASDLEYTNDLKAKIKEVYGK